MSFVGLARFPGTGPSPSSGGTTINAIVTANQAGTGNHLVSSGFPVPPGLVPESMISPTTGAIEPVRVLVLGVEVAASVTSIRGRHHDGSLRSILIQFTYNMAQGNTYSATVIIGGGVRQFADPTYIRPNYTIVVTNNNTIYPTDPSYLLTTQLTLRHVPAIGSGTTAEEALYTTVAENAFTTLTSTNSDGTANYDQVSAILSMWIRTGESKYLTWAFTKIIFWLPYFTASVTDQPSVAAVTNPDGRTQGNSTFGISGDGMGNEPYYTMGFSFAQMYLLTGYRDFWGIVAFRAQFNQRSITDQISADANIYDTQAPWYAGGRWNYRSSYGSMLAALQIDATIPVSEPGAGLNGRQLNWPNQMNWLVTALSDKQWNIEWIPFGSGSGNVPALNVQITQGSVSATLFGVYQQKFDPALATNAAMPTTGFLMITNRTGGNFAAGAITGVGASATGIQVTDYRNGLTGSAPNGYTRGDEALFQNIFAAHFLMDYYLYFCQDSRIPALIQTHANIVAANIRTTNSGDPQPSHPYCVPYEMENPPSVVPSASYDLAFFPLFFAFAIKTVGDLTTNGRTYSQWYATTIDALAANDLNWQWKIYGERFTWNLSAPWMMQQSTLVNYGPATLRVPAYWSTIPGDTPDLS